MRLKRLLALLLVVVAPIAVRAQVNITTVAGGGSTCVQATQPPATPCATSVSIGGPSAAVKDAAGNLYILDNFQNRIFKVDISGNVTIFAGNGTPGSGGDGGPAINAQFNGPRSMFMDNFGNIFIADADNGTIREIAGPTPSAGQVTGNIYTVAGNAQLGLGYSGDNGPATSAQMFFPDGVWVDTTGNIFIGDKANHIVREVAAATGLQYTISMTKGNIYTIAGTPGVAGFSGDGSLAKNAKLNNPWGVYGDSFGNIFIADSTNCLIREVAVTTDIITTVAGVLPTSPTTPSCGFNLDGVAATSAQLNHGPGHTGEGGPLGIYVDASGNLFISDAGNQIVREVPVADGTNYTVSMKAHNIYTIAGAHGTIGHDGFNLDDPSNVFLDGAGDVFISDTDSHEVRELLVGTATINIVAGNGFEFYGGDGGPATNAELATPAGVATDGAGHIFVADTLSSVIREFTAGGNIQRVAGRPDNSGYNSDGGLATLAAINGAQGVFVDGHNNIFIADTNNCLIRKVVASTGNIATVAGVVPSPNPNCGFSSDLVLATTSQLNSPAGVFVNSAGDIFIADAANHVIREVPTATGTQFGILMTGGNIYTIAGVPGTKGSDPNGGAPGSAHLNQPSGVFVDNFGNVFIADTGNHVIREIPALSGTNYGVSMLAGNIYAVAGTPKTGGFGGDGGLATAAKLLTPFSVLVDAAGNIFISDTGNQVIREVAAATGNITTVAGTKPTGGVPNPGFSGDTGAAIGAKLNTPQGLAAVAGNLLVADSLNNRIRSMGPNLLSGPAPAITLGPTTVTFTTPQFVGVTSAAIPISLANNGTAALTITAITSANADFTVNDNCPKSPSTLAAGAACTINVMFSPTLRGTRTGSVSVADNATGTPHKVALSGSGIQPTADLTPSTGLTFAAQIVGTTSAAQTVTVMNNGNTALTFAASNAILLGGTSPGDFAFAPAAANTCGAPLAVGAHCTISVTFTPTAATVRSATVTIADNAGNTPQTVALSGTGLPTPSTATLSGTTLTFGTQLVSNASAAQSVTLTNNGTGALNIASINISAGDFALAPASTCGTSLAGGGTKCTISVTFTPTAAGSRTATITLTDDAGGVSNSHQMVNVTGMGSSLAFTAASTSSTTQTVKAGQTATYNLQIAETGGAPGDTLSVAIACTGAPSLATCSGPTTAVSVPAGGTAPVAITVTTTAGGATVPAPQFRPQMQPPAAIRTLPLFLLALLSVAITLAWMQSPAGRMRAVRLACVAGLLMLPVSAAVLLQGCGGGSSGSVTPPPPTPGTPTGTSTLTVTFTPTLNGKAQAAQTTTLTLVVQ